MLFSEWKLAHVKAKNRLVRSATYEGLGDEQGYPRPELGALYRTLADNDVGTIITGFSYVSRRGRAMHPFQCGIDDDDKIGAWEKVVSEARRARGRAVLLLQIAHAGLQTLPRVTGTRPWAPSVWRSRYFGARPVAMTDRDVRQAVGEFAAAALRAKKAGFDGVQVHAAHGYLVHQFLSPLVNRRTDGWGKDRFAFLREIIVAAKEACGDGFPLFVKLSAPDGLAGGVDLPLACAYAAKMATIDVEAVEVSYGTMDHALNIFRGAVPLDLILRHNPLFCTKPGWALSLWKRFGYPRLKRELVPFGEHYNLEAARQMKRAANLPVIVVGGIRRLAGMEAILSAGDADAVALCRPFICEPDFATKLRTSAQTTSMCRNCNCCAVMCDSRSSLTCYQPKRQRLP
jgi:2,4-dienoyl-CoA reductase-like NADH-dependent reductase (Old Yellow Enzyme family)